MSAKELLTKIELQRFHPEMMTALEHALGRDVPVLNGATVGGNRTVAEMKAEDMVAVARKAAQEAEKEAKAAGGRVEALHSQEAALRDEIKALRARVLSEKEINALKGKKTITGALKGVSYEDYINIQQTAMRVGKVDTEKDKAVERAKAAERQAAAAEERARKAQNEKPSMMLQIEYAKLRSRLERIEGWLTRLLDFLPSHFRDIVKNILRDRDPFKQERGQRREYDRGIGGMER